MRKAFFGLICLFAFTAQALADDWDDAVSAYRAGRYNDAIALLVPLADAGKVEAQNKLADIYIDTREYYDALYWTQKAVEQGDLSAQVTMAHNYLKGRGVAVDFGQAVHWFSIAAERGDPAALYNLAVLTMKGLGTESNPREAVRLFQAAAELDQPYALYALGGIYLDGDYVVADLKLSLKYLQRAAELGQRRAMVLLALLLEEMPELPDNWGEAVLYYQAAIAYGCTDVDDLAREAAKHLSADEVAGASERLDNWQATYPGIYSESPGLCISDTPLAM